MKETLETVKLKIIDLFISKINKWSLIFLIS